MNDDKKKSLLFRIGLGRRSGKLIVGTEMVCDGIRDGKVILAIEADSVSANSKKRIENCASYYETQIIKLDGVSAEELGKAIGKSSVACVGATDENIAKLILGGLRSE